MPCIHKLYIQAFFTNSVFSKNYVYKSLLLFYCITGIKPLICIKKIRVNGRGLKKKKITNLFLALNQRHTLFNILFFLVSRQIPLLKFFTSFPLKKNNFSIAFRISVQDDDSLLQSLEIKKELFFQVSFFSKSLVNLKQLRTLLYGLKIPTSI